MLGISTDPAEENLAFKKQEGLPYSLLSDTERKVCMIYGACAFAEAYFANRITYVIDEEGLIQKVYRNVDPDTHASEILAAI